MPKNESVNINPSGFREYDARWLYPKDINQEGIKLVGQGLGTQIISKTKKILSQVYRSKNLNKVIILINPKQKQKIIDLIPFSEFYFNTDGPMAYICKDYTCDLPTNDLNKIKELLEY